MSCPAPMQNRDRLETTRGLLGGKSGGRGQEGTFWPAVFSRSQTPVINHPHPHPRGMVQDRPQCPLPLHAGAGGWHVPSLSPGWAGHHTGTSQAGQKPLVAGWGAGPEHRLGSLPPSWPRTTSGHQWGSVHRVLAELPSVTEDGESQDARCWVITGICSTFYCGCPVLGMPHTPKGMVSSWDAVYVWCPVHLLSRGGL